MRRLMEEEEDMEVAATATSSNDAKARHRKMYDWYV